MTEVSIARPSDKKLRRRFKRRVVLIAMLLLLTGVMVLGSCATIITPPAEVHDGVTILVVDYGRHSSLVLPDFRGGMVEYAYGEHAWFARNRNQWYRVGPVLFLPTSGTLGRWPDRPIGLTPAMDEQTAATWGLSMPVMASLEGDVLPIGWIDPGQDGPKEVTDAGHRASVDDRSIQGLNAAIGPGVQDESIGDADRSLLPPRGADDSVLGWAGGGRVLRLVVERERVIELKAELDEIFSRTERPIFNPVFRMYFADHPRSYWFGFNCNHAVAQWLRQLGCRTRGWPLLSNFRLAEP